MLLSGSVFLKSSNTNWALAGAIQELTNDYDSRSSIISKAYTIMSIFLMHHNMQILSQSFLLNCYLVLHSLLNWTFKTQFVEMYYDYDVEKFDVVANNNAWLLCFSLPIELQGMCYFICCEGINSANFNFYVNYRNSIPTYVWKYY